MDEDSNPSNPVDFGSPGDAERVLPGLVRDGSI